MKYKLVMGPDSAFPGISIHPQPISLCDEEDDNHSYVTAVTRI